MIKYEIHYNDGAYLGTMHCSTINMDEIEQMIKNTINSNNKNPNSMYHITRDNFKIKCEGLTDSEIESIWEMLEDITTNEDEELESDFYMWEIGTDKMDIWSWFDKNHSKGIRYLVNEYEMSYTR